MSDWMNEITYDMLPPPHQKIADVVGVRAALELCEHVQGAGLYIPKTDRAYNKIRNRQIRMDYIRGGWTASALAKKYHLSEASIRRIIKDFRPGQMRIEEFESPKTQDN